ncbi:VOC family protein [Embleya sp. NBC_00888]|uniref:VOC family protein n=1 Tax=Embleya sp. NBC_00888 TaxID=2975960 RepID=UPI003864F1EB|nr:VOC family protein [Embleya sp. NBC_00888]
MLTTEFAVGAPIWIDLGVGDIPAAGAFYGDLFGWDLEITGPETGGYGILRKGGKSVGALAPLMDESAASVWSVYFHALDADATTKAVERAGGGVLLPPMDVLDMGRLAGFTDSTGVGFMVWEPGTNKGLELVQDVGALCWTELYTADRSAATGFYHAVFGWNYQDFPSPDGDYTLAYPGEDVDAMHAGVAEVDPRETTPQWQIYIGVDDCDASFARAIELGGTELTAPYDIPDVGRIAMVNDPFGARFAMIKGIPPAK